MMNYHFVGNRRYGDKKNTSASLGSFQEKPYINNVREYVYLKYCTPVALIVCVCVYAKYRDNQIISPQSASG